MAWRVNFVAGDDGKSVELDDLAPDVFAQVAKDADAGLTYWGVYRFPVETPETSYGIVCAAAKQLGVDPPAKPSNMREEAELRAMFEEVEDIEDQPMMDGFPPVPDETESGSPSTSSGDTTGSPQTSEDSPCETS